MSHDDSLRRAADGLENSAASLAILHRDVAEIQRDVREIRERDLHDLRTRLDRLDEAIRGNGQAGLREQARKHLEMLEAHNRQLLRLQGDIAAHGALHGNFAVKSDLAGIRTLAESAHETASLKIETVRGGVEITKARLAGLFALATALAGILASIIAKGGQ